MNSGDFVLLTNLQTGGDASYPGENACSFLPDVRRMDGLRGDFFKGANAVGNGDPNNHSVFPLYTDSPITFAASEYSMLCYKLLIDKGFSLRDGHHGRVLWENTTSYTSEDLVAIYDGWSGSRWYEYCMDMAKLPIDGQTTNPGWNGTIQKFRVDPHEWSHSRLNDDITVPPDAVAINVPYYFDYIKLRQYPTAKKRITLVYDVTDSDDASPTVQFFSNTANSTSGGVAIPSQNLSCSGRVCVWDTTHLGSGTFYVYATVADSLNNGAFSAPSKVVVDNGSDSDLAAPDLSVDQPTNGATICSDLQLKGYALQSATGVNVPVQAVQVLVDGRFFALVDPTEFSPAAKAAFPNADSSNTGFNRLVDASSLSTGSHTVRIEAYGLHAASTVKTLTITKQGGTCADPSGDSEPAGAPVNPIVGIPPGAGVGLSMSLNSSGNNLLYDVLGIDNKCTVVRLKITDTAAKLSTGPFTFVQSVTDVAQLRSGAIGYISEDVPRLVLAASGSGNTCAKNKKYKSCIKTCPKKGKKRAPCLTKCQRKAKCSSSSATATGDRTASFQADCGDGSGTSSTIEVDATTVGNSAKTVSTIDAWIDALRLSGKSR